MNARQITCWRRSASVACIPLNSDSVGRAAGGAVKSCCPWLPTTPAPRGRRRFARRSSSTASGSARPVRSTDGRYVVAGWRADTFVAGTPEPRHDEVVSSAVRLHEATAKLERPRFLTQPPVAPWADVDVFIAADRAAWEERPLQSLPPGARVSPGSADGQRSIDLINQLAGLRKPTKSPNQLVHGDLYGTVLFAGTAAPGITDITPYWRPASWAAGVVVVDALSWGEADDGLVERWAAAAGVAADVVARVDVQAGRARTASALHRRGVSWSGPHRRAGAADALGLDCADFCAQNSWRTSVNGIRPSLASTPSARSSSSWRVVRCGAGLPGRRDHPVPRQVRGIRPHDPADDARAGKPCRRGDVAVGRHPARRDRRDERAYRLDLFVGDGGHG